MFKRRVLGLALALALIASAGVGLFQPTSADNSGTITVTASISTVLTLTLNTGEVRFGDGLDFLGDPGNHSNTGRGACQIANGARYVSQDIVATVVSSTSYDLSVRSDGSTASLNSFNTFQDYARIGSGGFTDCATTDSAFTLHHIWFDLVGPGPDQNWHFAPNQSGTAGRQHIQYYTLDVVINGPVGLYTTGVVYEVQAI